MTRQYTYYKPPRRAKASDKKVSGRIYRSRGKRFEEYIDILLQYYRTKGWAMVEKTPEPMRPTKSLGNGRFIAHFEKKAQPDYKGTLKGGRAIVMEAKYTATSRIQQDRITKAQRELLDAHHALGAICCVVVGFRDSDVYRVPWEVWRNMKERFGRRYVTAEDLEEYRVKTMRNGVLELL